MNFLTGKRIDRRALLRGLGTTIALPLLDAMFPALAVPTAKANQARRVAVVYVPNGIIMKDWKIAATSRASRRRSLATLYLSTPTLDRRPGD